MHLGNFPNCSLPVPVWGIHLLPCPASLFSYDTGEIWKRKAVEIKEPSMVCTEAALISRAAEGGEIPLSGQHCQLAEAEGSLGRGAPVMSQLN